MGARAIAAKGRFLIPGFRFNTLDTTDSGEDLLRVCLNDLFFSPLRLGEVI